jgi:hypothetical protein
MRLWFKLIKRKAEASQFRLKAAHVLWATAKCRHPGSRDRKMFFTRRGACHLKAEGYFPEAAPAITRRMSAKMLIQAADTLRAELDNKEKRKRAR